MVCILSGPEKVISYNSIVMKNDKEWKRQQWGDGSQGQMPSLPQALPEPKGEGWQKYTI